jgi:hypothetical protein
LANRKIRLVTPPVFMRFPARMKKGMARSVKLVVEAYILWGSMVKSEPLPRPTKNPMAVRAIATAIGTLIIMSTNSTRKIINVSISDKPFADIFIRRGE